MKLSDYDYQFSQDLIAVSPASPRSSSRLLCFERSHERLSESLFNALPDFLSSSDVIVMNKTKVIPARFEATKKTGGRLEGLFFESRDKNRIKVWLQGRVKEGDELIFSDKLSARVMEKKDRDIFLDISQAAFLEFLSLHGKPALPPYILKRRRELQLSEDQLSDFESYQTLMAEASVHFSVAAPTASFHFDELVFKKLRERGVQIETISLHIGAGTFLPLENSEVEKNHLHSEFVEIEPEVWERLLRYKSEGKRLIAVGTTVTRSLEAAWLRHQESLPIDSFQTDLFIYPPYSFQMVDSLITNFHQPKSSLLVLIDAFSKAKWRQIYNYALEKRYRLFSYGDALWIQ